MTSFLQSISQDQDELRAIREFKQNPFKKIPNQNCGFKYMFHFNFDKTYVKLESLKKLQKHIKYIPLKDLSPRLNSRTFFTIGCIYEISRREQNHNSLLDNPMTILQVCDLHNTKFTIRCDDAPTTLRQFDMIAIANPDISVTLRVKSKEQILRIGHNEKVQHCSQFDPKKYGKDEKCGQYIDIRNGPHCDYHAHNLAMQSGAQRPMLKLAQTQMKFDTPANSPMSSPLHGIGFMHGPSLQLPDNYIQKYLEEHKSGRAAKINKILNSEKPKHQIGAGLTKGDLIIL
ncbi:hypothetical protein TRFO_20488 [Tritrichomonas foetus]|uniref:Uncharacterized protein n=1 Tax=Tritrichomonas foetus TaxID=1144522 RepID=A0A1J4KHC5_9EUKA|nr:hypothetical protein TRFO_20488 [Tritrichomonas foetus]|eukprot:OHT10344.1 hypothetical protein TRFO_20488 [Tritrichomonas foetus]